MDVVKNASYDRIKDFYKKWYRPELMSVVAVGTGKYIDYLAEQDLL